MILTDQIHPTPEQFKNFVSGYPKDKPVTMINILKFKAIASNNKESGLEAYTRYGMHALPFLKKANARLLWRGNVVHTLIGDSSDQAHVVLLVRYPTITHFINMTSDPDYIKVAEDRTTALEFGGLWACEEEYSAL